MVFRHHPKGPTPPTQASLADKATAQAAYDKAVGRAAPTQNSQAHEDRSGALKGALFMGAVLLVNVIWIWTSGQVPAFLHALSQVRLGWVGLCMAAMVAYLALGTLAYSVTCWVDKDAPVGVADLCAVEAAGTFFGNLTPMMAGAVPAQIWRLLKAGVDFGESMAIQLTRFSLYQVAEVVLSLVCLVWVAPTFFRVHGAMMWVVVACFVIKLAQMSLTLAVCLFPRFVTRVGLALLDFMDSKALFSRFKGSIPGWKKQLTGQVDLFSRSFRRALDDWRPVAVMLGVSAAQLALFFGTPWFILYAFGISLSPWECVCYGAMVQLVSTTIPLPGGTGGVEAAFALFFGPLFGSAATAGYLLWRLVTFYGYTVLCGLAQGFHTKPRSLTVRQRWARLFPGH